MNIGLVGVGKMGLLVAKTLVEAGHVVVAYDSDPRASNRAREVGVNAAETPQSVAAETQITLLVLPGPPQVEAVVIDEQGVLDGAPAGHTIVDMSTVGPQTTRLLGEQAAEVGVDYLDAPILGRPNALGRWVLPVGGEQATFDRCRPVLSVLAREVIHVGPLGAGNTLKLLNAMMFAAINAMTAEMMTVAVKAGLPPKVLFETISSSAAATVSGLFKEVGAKIVARDFEPIFPIRLLCKDNGLAVAMAKDFDAPPLLASMIQTLNELARAKGLGAEDSSALVKVYEELLDVDLP